MEERQDWSNGSTARPRSTYDTDASYDAPRDDRTTEPQPLERQRTYDHPRPLRPIRTTRNHRTQIDKIGETTPTYGSLRITCGTGDGSQAVGRRTCTGMKDRVCRRDERRTRRMEEQTRTADHGPRWRSCCPNVAYDTLDASRGGRYSLKEGKTCAKTS